MKSFIRIKNLKYKDILNGINFSIKKNDFITISGSNKCGKTTLIKILSRLINTNNKVIINDKPIEEYSFDKYNSMVGKVILNEDNKYLFDTVEKELKYISEEYYNEIIKLFKLSKYQKTNPNNLEKNIEIKFLLAKEVISKSKILLLDDISLYMNKKETEELMKILKTLQKKNDMTIIMTTDKLEETVYSDYLYILSEGKISLKGKPLEVLENDNVLNKLGLELPFMVDLSVKLKDYDLVDRIELDMDRMVNILWK